MGTALFLVLWHQSKCRLSPVNFLLLSPWFSWASRGMFASGCAWLVHGKAGMYTPNLYTWWMLVCVCVCVVHDWNTLVQPFCHVVVMSYEVYQRTLEMELIVTYIFRSVYRRVSLIPLISGPSPMHREPLTKEKGGTLLLYLWIRFTHF